MKNCKYWVTPYIMRAFVFLFLAACSADDKNSPPGSKTSSNAAPLSSPDNIGTKQTQGLGDVSPAIGLRHEYFGSAATALKAILKETNPKIIGFGEFHQENDTTGTLSSLERFGDSVLPVFSANTSDLILETWVSKGNCGKTEKKVVQNVEQTINRPQETESETVRLLKRAKRLGVQPHILEVDCKDYDSIMMVDGGVDYFEMLALIAKQLTDQTLKTLDYRKKNRKPTDGDPMIAVYGGAIHNDVVPIEYFESFTFAPALKKAAKGRYVEIDLYVPEFVRNAPLAKKENWYPVFEQYVSSDKVLLIKRQADSYIIVFKQGVKNASASKIKSSTSR